MAKAIKKAKRKPYKSKEWAVLSIGDDGLAGFLICENRQIARYARQTRADIFPEDDHRVARVSIREIPERRAR